MSVLQIPKQKCLATYRRPSTVYYKLFEMEKFHIFMDWSYKLSQWNNDNGPVQ